MKKTLYTLAFGIAMLQSNAASIEIRAAKGTNDSIVISSYQLNMAVKTYTTSFFTKLKDGFFSYEFPETAFPQYITLRRKDTLAPLIRQLLLEPTDSLIITLTENNRCIVSGKGSQKWKNHTALGEFYQDLGLTKKIYNCTGPSDVIDWPEVFEQNMHMLSKLSAGMSELAKTCLAVGVFSELASSRIAALTSAMRRNPGMDRNWIRQEIKGLIDCTNKLLNIYNDSLLALSYTFPIMLKYAIIMDKFSIDNKPENLLPIYDTITAMCKGPVRNSILMQMLVRNRTNSQFYGLAQKTLPVLSDPRHINILSRIIDAEKPGNQVQFATFTDVAVRTVSLTNYKDTVILVDLWFTGCVPCRLMHKAMVPLEARMKGKAFKMVTISIDRDLEMWKTSIENGLYTNPNDLNLNTNGKGSDHPFFKYYQLLTYPTLMLIDKQGRLVSTAVPDPKLGKFEEMVAAIESLL